MNTPDNVIQHLAEIADFAARILPSSLDGNVANIGARAPDSMFAGYV